MSLGKLEMFRSFYRTQLAVCVSRIRLDKLDVVLCLIPQWKWQSVFRLWLVITTKLKVIFFVLLLWLVLAGNFVCLITFIEKKNIFFHTCEEFYNIVTSKYVYHYLFLIIHQGGIYHDWDIWSCVHWPSTFHQFIILPPTNFTKRYPVSLHTTIQLGIWQFLIQWV